MLTCHKLHVVQISEDTNECNESINCPFSLLGRISVQRMQLTNYDRWKRPAICLARKKSMGASHSFPGGLLTTLLTSYRSQLCQAYVLLDVLCVSQGINVMFGLLLASCSVEQRICYPNDHRTLAQTKSSCPWACCNVCRVWRLSQLRFTNHAPLAQQLIVPPQCGDWFASAGLQYS